jgi:predicted phosphodiesterase
VRFLHTADWQIGMKAADLGEAGEKLRAERLHAALRVIEAARSHAVDFLVLAGDTFEDNAVDRVLVRKVADILGSAGCPVYIVPGNHDPLVPGSIWDHTAWTATPNVHVLREEVAVEVPGGTLFPCVCREKHARRDPTAWIPAEPAAGQGIRIGLAHGTVEGIDLQEAEYPVPRDAATRRRLDYLALGHWHSFGTFEANDGARRMAYAGTHEPTKFGERDSGNVILVEIGASGAAPRLTPIPTGRFTWTQMSPEIRVAADLARVVREVEQIAEPGSRLLDLRFRGVIPAAEMAEYADLRASLRELLSARLFFHRLDESAVRLVPGDDSWIDQVPPGALRAAAVRLFELAAFPSPAGGAPRGGGLSDAGPLEEGVTPEIANRALIEFYTILMEVPR